MGQRPLSVTIVGWGMVVYGLYRLVNALAAILLLGTPELKAIVQKATPRTQELVGVVLDLAMSWYAFLAVGEILIGTFILAGAKWSRNLFVVMFLFIILADWAFFPSQFWWDLVPGIVIAALLFSPGANDYFRQPH